MGDNQQKMISEVLLELGKVEEEIKKLVRVVF